MDLTLGRAGPGWAEWPGEEPCCTQQVGTAAQIHKTKVNHQQPILPRLLLSAEAVNLLRAHFSHVAASILYMMCKVPPVQFLCFGSSKQERRTCRLHCFWDKSIWEEKGVHGYGREQESGSKCS
ncbi:hypothetical protein Y1Q_0008891 [Alligator mississippiensis]|uniref:Uncharacterized protein n=1 Tax=Alligator mississippiensis TaxID=8496 RepID=A0A151MRG6_ALLMI|nr:hypothetical protein Y1Q_0008891 [Alligator mississippiensis]